MAQFRDAQTCNRCRAGKRRCDKARPSCTRCERAGTPCNYDDHSTRIIPFSDSPIDTETDDGNARGSMMLAPPTSNHGRVVKKRVRACLSCTRCHRLKIKCDKSHPCGRCTRSGYETMCIYTHKAKPIETPRPLPPFALTGEDPEYAVATWFLRRRGSSHWKALLNRLESLSGLDAPPFVIAMREHVESDCSSDFALPGNFPFGTVESTRYASLDKVQQLLQASSADANDFIARYFEAYHPSMPVLDPLTFHRNVENFIAAPEKIDASWLAVYLIVLGLGAHASHRDHDTCAEFFYAGEACLAKTPYMFRPTTTNISTLCLMVLAKQIAYATCWVLDTCWNVMGVVVRLSMMMVLHQEWMPELDEPAIVSERDRRRRLWNVVVYLDIQMSLITGQQSLLPQDTLLATVEMNNPSTLEECWDSLLPQSFPVICHFLARINSSTDQVKYDEVIEYDLEIRRLVRQFVDLPGSNVLHLTFDIYFRRSLLVLHRRYAMDPDAPFLYSTSYWSSLECSLALIGHQRILSETSSQYPNIEFIGRPYMLDFFGAALTTCIHLLRSDTPLSTTIIHEEAVPPRQTILSTLKSCVDIIAREQSKSLCFRTGYRILTAVFELLPDH
ncbi:hypothetical protein BKA66DRAFT_553815 [Pyrenochaeta sp. MPI-SDFR-AT-0127]|nr:hypothetical protein BKA66DRAFT_553815 [Pyrenochaeta sp. MPI-SDFR-AT-0127]